MILKRESDHASVTIEDDGRGFDYPALINDPNRKRGLGLGGLIEPAQIMCSELNIDSDLGRGTRLLFIVPTSVFCHSR